MMAERIMCKNLKSTLWVSRWQRLPVCAQPGIIKTSLAEKGSGWRKQKQRLRVQKTDINDCFQNLLCLFSCDWDLFQKEFRAWQKAFSADGVAVERCDSFCIFHIWCHVEQLHRALLWAMARICSVLFEYEKYRSNNDKKNLPLPLFNLPISCLLP